MIEIAKLNPDVSTYDKKSHSHMIKDEHIDPFTPVVLTFSSIDAIMFLTPGQTDGICGKGGIVQPSASRQSLMYGPTYA